MDMMDEQPTLIKVKGNAVTDDVQNPNDRTENDVEKLDTQSTPEKALVVVRADNQLATSDGMDTNNKKSATAENINDDPDEDQQVVPEGGWGWMIVVGIFLMFTVLFGYVFALSVFFLEWMRYFDASATEISWVMSLPPAIGGFMSPVSGALCTKYGSRRVALVGSTISFVGSFAASFSKSVAHLHITIGFMIGIGSSLVFSPTLVMLGQYFQKRYIFANSVAFCGYSFAQMIVPRLAQLLIEEYGWRGALLILSAVLSHMYIVAALLRPRTIRKPSKQVATHDLPLQVKNKEAEINHESKEIWTSTTSLHMFDNDAWHPSKSTLALYHQNDKDYEEQNEKRRDEKRSSLYAKFRSAVGSMVSYLAHTYGLSALSKSILYMFTLLGASAGGIGWFVTNGHLVARAVSTGISQNDAALLMSLIGVGSFVGRASHGIVIDKGLVNRDVFFIASFAFTGLLSFVNPFLDTFASLSLFACLFGVFHGAANSLVYAMMRLQVAPSEAAAALSFGVLVLAVSNTIGGVLAGVLFDKTGNYDISFYFAGSLITAGTLILSIVFLLNHIKQKRITKSMDLELDCKLNAKGIE